jgi:hypothetical protein
MTTPVGARMFTVGTTLYIWDDLVLAAHLWGEWSVLEQRVRDGLACLARLDDVENDADDAADDDEVEAAATEFRYARDLIAASDLEAWLEARGLTVDAWYDYLRRTMLLSRWADDLDEIRETYEIDDDELPDAILCEAMCSGLARLIADRLAARAAIHTRMLDDGDAPEVDADARAVIARLAGDAVLDRALPAVSPQTRRERLEWLSRLEASWMRFVARVAPPDALRKTIATHALDWICVSVDAVVSPNEELARELTLCVREDGRTIDDVAAEAGLRCETREWWLDDVEPAVRDALIGAQRGDLVGPVSAKPGHLVLTVIDKRLPSEHDAVVRARAERTLLARDVEHEVANRVAWHRTL